MQVGCVCATFTYAMNPTVLELKNKGFRITKVRSAIVSIFEITQKPISVGEIMVFLYKKDLSVNKTTIYREVQFLLNQNLIHEIEFGDGKKRYELNTGQHHHHIVCVSCGNIEDIEDFDYVFKTSEEKIQAKTGFNIQEHNIEFFGLCKNCQDK